MNDFYYPVQCTRCKEIVGYSDIDFNNPDEHYTAVWCKNCTDIKPKENFEN